MGQNQVVLRHLINHFLHELGSEWANGQMNKHCRACKRSKQCRTSVWVSGASKQANGRAIGPVLTSQFWAVLNYRVRRTRRFLFTMSTSFLGISLVAANEKNAVSRSEENCCNRVTSGIHNSIIKERQKNFHLFSATDIGAYKVASHCDQFVSFGIPRTKNVVWMNDWSHRIPS